MLNVLLLRQSSCIHVCVFVWMMRLNWAWPWLALNYSLRAANNLFCIVSDCAPVRLNADWTYEYIWEWKKKKQLKIVSKWLSPIQSVAKVVSFLTFVDDSDGILCEMHIRLRCIAILSYSIRERAKRKTALPQQNTYGVNRTSHKRWVCMFECDEIDWYIVHYSFRFDCAAENQLQLSG